jgi:hypothetical protein
MTELTQEIVRELLDRYSYPDVATPSPSLVHIAWHLEGLECKVGGQTGVRLR